MGGAEPARIASMASTGPSPRAAPVAGCTAIRFYVWRLAFACSFEAILVSIHFEDVDWCVSRRADSPVHLPDPHTPVHRSERQIALTRVEACSRIAGGRHRTELRPVVDVAVAELIDNPAACNPQLALERRQPLSLGPPGLDQLVDHCLAAW